VGGARGQAEQADRRHGPLRGRPLAGARVLAQGLPRRRVPAAVVRDSSASTPRPRLSRATSRASRPPRCARRSAACPGGRAASSPPRRARAS
jgi:hypothetical protein